ncbi:MAG: oxygenase MpaB family protein [Planctomycetota bacterium]
MSEVEDPVAGLFGPGSMMWRVSREVALFLGGGSAALLQLAHPHVAHAVEQHSQTRDNPGQRFRGTFEAVFGMTFGSLEDALRSARRVHAIHTRITGVIDEPIGRFSAGSSYEANWRPSLRWVAATLWATSVQLYELLVEPLTAGEKERFYREAMRSALLFGLGPEDLPIDWPDFLRYYDRMLEGPELGVGRAGSALAGFLLEAPRTSLALPAGWYRVLTTGLLPPRFRDEFHLPFGPRERLIFRASVRALRLLVRGAPRAARYLPAYRAARRRLRGDPDPTRPAAFDRLAEAYLQRP